MFSRRPYRQGIFENLSRQEYLTVNRFTLVETFFLEVNLEVSNFYQRNETPLLNFEVSPVVPLLNLRGVPSPTLKL